MTNKENASFCNSLFLDWEDHSPVMHFSVEGQLDFPVWLFIPRHVYHSAD